MAVTGCDFVCKNKECKHNGAGIIMTSPWPLGDIDEIISSQKVVKNTPFKEELEKLKAQGRKYACIALPDCEKIPVVGYRVHMWCNKCPCVWTYDAIIPENFESKDGGIGHIEAAIKNSNIPENCPTCNGQLKSLLQLLDKEDEGIECTSCHKKLQKSVWFSNEKGTSDKINPLIKLPPKE